MEKAERYQTSLLLDPELHYLPPNHLHDMSVSFFGGCLAGVANAIVGHPLDTLKVRMQMLNLSLLQGAQNILKNEGPSAFYKGITSPLYTVPFVYAVCLGSYEIGRWLQGVRFHDQMTLYQGTLAGAWAGLMNAIVLTPMELVKCRLQMEIIPRQAKRTSAAAMTMRVLKTEGIRGLFRGNLIAIIREVPGCAIYFGAYEYGKMQMNARYGEGSLSFIAAGGFAGFVSWIVSYPQDVIKTRLQCDSTMSSRYPTHKWLKDGGIISCTKEIWRKDGMKGFWRGFSACSIRSLMSEGFTFLVYEKTKAFFSKSHEEAM